MWGVSVQSQADLSSLWCCSYDRLGAWPEGGGVCGACQSSLKLTCLHCDAAGSDKKPAISDMSSNNINNNTISNITTTTMAFTPCPGIDDDEEDTRVRNLIFCLFHFSTSKHSLYSMGRLSYLLFVSLQHFKTQFVQYG